MTMTNTNYTIIDKNGKVIQNESFEDYDKLADHMLEIADRWYAGEYYEGDSLQISSFDETGSLIYSDTATFGETRESANQIPESFNIVAKESTRGKGFGEPLNPGSQ